MANSTNNYEVGTLFTFKRKQYSFLSAFSAYPALTLEELRDMPEMLRKDRETAFYAYIANIAGEDPTPHVQEGFEARRLNTNDCYLQSFVRVSVQAKLGTVKINGISAQFVDVVVGSNVVVEGTATDALSEIDGWYDVTNDPNSTTKLSTDNPFTLTNVQNDIVLEVRFNEVEVVNVIVSNSDGHGNVSGGGTVRYDDFAFISCVDNFTGNDYLFNGWYVKGTTTLISNSKNYYYKPNKAHASSDGNIYLEAQYAVAPATLYMEYSHQSPVSSTMDNFYYYLAITKPVSCDITCTAIAYDRNDAALGSATLTISANSSISDGLLVFMDTVVGNSDFNYFEITDVLINNISTNTCGQIPIQW